VSTIPVLAGAAAGIEALVGRARQLCVPGQRRILGIVGAPGSGKSTVAGAVVAALAPAAIAVPMDGFHLANAELVRLGRRDRKGAPDTFDAAGYVALLRRLTDPAERTVYAPAFHREIEEPIAGEIPIPAGTPLIVTEGNYLLVDDGPWAPIRALLDEVWFIEPDERTRIERLVTRHVSYGKTGAEAKAWALGTDERNARLIRSTRDRADLVIRPTSSSTEVDNRR
jgi:pantothenate kinase